MNHSFNVELATKFKSVEKAVLIENMMFWVNKNKANNKNHHDGHTWIYNSSSAFVELFPYMTNRSIRRWLTELENDGYIKSGNYNKVKYDKTKWYTISNSYILNLYSTPLAKMANGMVKMANGMVKMANGTTQNGQPIPDINTDINTDIVLSNNTSNSNINKSLDIQEEVVNISISSISSEEELDNVEIDKVIDEEMIDISCNRLFNICFKKEKQLRIDKFKLVNYIIDKFYIYHDKETKQLTLRKSDMQSIVDTVNNISIDDIKPINSKDHETIISIINDETKTIDYKFRVVDDKGSFIQVINKVSKFDAILYKIQEWTNNDSITNISISSIKEHIFNTKNDKYGILNTIKYKLKNWRDNKEYDNNISLFLAYTIQEHMERDYKLFNTLSGDLSVNENITKEK